MVFKNLISSQRSKNTKVDATYVRSIRAFIYLTTTRACHLNFHLPPPDCYHHLTCNYSNPLLPIGKPITLTHFISLICRLYDFTCNYSESTIGQMVSTYVRTIFSYMPMLSFLLQNDHSMKSENNVQPSKYNSDTVYVCTSLLMFKCILAVICMHYTVLYVQIPLSKRLKCRDRGVSIIRCMTKHHLPTRAPCAIMEKVIYVHIHR